MKTSKRRTSQSAKLALLAILICAISNLALADGDARVDALFAYLDQGIRPGAAVLVVRDGKILHQRGYGYANLGTKEHITPQSAFRLASVSKQFTAMGIARLVDQGKLGLDDLVSRYVPQLAAFPGITIRHLLTHTSGLPDYYDVIDTSAWVARGEIPGNADVMAYEGGMGKPLFAPGERYEYSNPAYEALPLVIEAVTGMPFREYMAKEVFGPAGMRHSLIHDDTRPAIPNRVLGYSQTETGFEPDDDDPLNGITGSGGQYSTLEDFFAWDQALYTDRLVSAAMLRQIFTSAKLNNGEETGYGLGWMLDTYHGQRRQHHTGSWVGFRTAIERYPDLHFTVVVLGNFEQFEAEQAADQVADLYLE